MPTLNGRNYTGVPGLNIREANGAIRFETPLITPATTTGERMLYVDSSDNLIYNNGASAITLGAAGASSGTPTLDAIYASDKTLSLGNGTLTFAGNMSTADNVVTVTNISGSTGAAIQITNSTTSNYDIKGTSDTWGVLGTGAISGLTLTLAGVAASTSLAMTLGNFVMSAGGIAITKAANNATFSVTNNTVTTASMVVIAGNAAFTGNTTSSFFTITPSGLTTGTAVYLPVAALTTGKAMHIVANAYTDGLVFNITSSSTVSTSTGRLFNLAHTATANVSHVIAEMATSAQDETVLLRLTASDVLALGKILHISASSMTTGTAIDAAALDALTTGIGLSIASTSTTLTTGSLIRVSTGTTGTVATNGIVSITATADFGSTSNIGLITAIANSTTAGTIMNLSGTALTTGVGLRLASTGTGLTSGSLLLVTTGTTGAVATNGIVSITATGAYTSTSNCGLLQVVANSVTTGATIVNISGTAMTTSVGLRVVSSGTGLTSGSLAIFTTGTTGAIATNGAVSIRGTGAYTSTSNVGLLDVVASALVGAGTVVRFAATAASQTASEILNITQSGATLTAYTGNLVNLTSGFSGSSSTGAAMLVTSVHDTAGDSLKIVNNALTLGAATMINLSHTTSVLGAGTSMLRLTSTGVDTGTTTGTMIDLAATAATAARLCQLVSATLSTGFGLHMTLNGLTSGSGLAIISSSADTTARGLIQLTSSSTSATGASAIRATMALISTHFRKVVTESGSGITLWWGDGTTGQGNLTGTAGDVLLNGGSNKPEYCTGTTNWSALV